MNSSAGWDATSGVRAAWFWLAILSAIPVSGISQSYSLQVVRSPNEVEDGYFGQAVLAIPDMSGDGKADIAVGAPGEGTGRVYLFDGDSLALLSTITPDAPESSSRFGNRIAVVPDVNKDSRDELLVFAEYLGKKAPRLIDGATGAEIRRHPTTSTMFGWGRSLSGVPDINGDGSGDYIISETDAHLLDHPDGVIERAGRVFVFSGATGESLFSMYSPEAVSGGAFGWSVDTVADLTGDGTLDLAVVAVAEDNLAGRVHLFDGKNGSFMRTLHAPDEDGEGFFGYSLAEFSNSSSRSQSEMLITEFIDGNENRILEIDAMTGETHRTFVSPSTQSSTQFGTEVANIGDFDGDGAGDFATSAMNEVVRPGLDHKGAVYAISGSTGLVITRIISPANVPDGYIATGFECELICKLPDVTGDGRDELLIGNPQCRMDDAPENIGFFYVVSYSNTPSINGWMALSQ